MRKRPLPTYGTEGRPQSKFRRPHVVPLTLTSPCFDLNVLICTPEIGNYHHWAVQFHNLSTDDGTIFEVQGVYPSLTFTTYQCRRLYYPLKIIQTVHIKEFLLSVSAFTAITDAIENQVPMDDRAVHWNCQDYVMDVLHMLEQEWWLEDDDADYLKVRRKLRSMYGPVELVHDAVIAYPASPSPDQGVGQVEDSLKVFQPEHVRPTQTILVSDDSGDG